MLLKSAGLLTRPLLVNAINSARMSSAVRKLDGRVAIVTASTDGYAKIKLLSFLSLTFLCDSRIGFSIAKRLAEDGAKVVISSRKQKNVDVAVDKLKKQGLDVTGLVCHVGSKDDRDKLIEQVSQIF